MEEGIFLHLLVFLPGINNPNPFLCSLLFFPKTEEPGLISNLLSLLRESTDFLQLPEPFSGVSSLTQFGLLNFHQSSLFNGSLCSSLLLSSRSFFSALSTFPLRNKTTFLSCGEKTLWVSPFSPPFLFG